MADTTASTASTTVATPPTEPPLPLAGGPVIGIRGACTHNLAHIDLDIPRNQLVVITGVSGSGKSSLAFDTLLAEGQRQYIQSLSVYARQFFDQMPRPEVDRIEGLQPTVAVDQHPHSQNARSTIGTVTEIYDFLRVLFSRAGTLACPECGCEIEQQSPAAIEEAIAALPSDTRVMLLAPLVRGRKGTHRDAIASAQQAGFARVRIDGQTYPLDDVPPLNARQRHDIAAVVDRIVIREGLDQRLSESVRLALKHGEGVLEIVYQIRGGTTASDVWHERVFSTHFACSQCGQSVAEVEPRTFSFNSPYGACPTCGGLGECEGFDPELVLPDESLSIHAGAIAPWRKETTRQAERHARLLSSFAPKRPLAQWPAAERKRLLYGDGDTFRGLFLELEVEWAGTTREAERELLGTFRGTYPCADCEGTRLGRAARSSRIAGQTIDEVTQLAISEARTFFLNLEFPPARQPIAAPLVREIEQRLKFLEQAGVGYLSLARRANTLSGGELQRVRLASAIGTGLVGVMYLLDEPSIGLHPRDNERLLGTLRELQRQGNSVIVVEHEETFMKGADYLIDCGPGAGSQGGKIIAQGTPEEVARHPTSLTAKFLSGRAERPPAPRRKPNHNHKLVLAGASLHNLQQVTFEVPLGLLVCVTGVSGSGKSSLVIETLAKQLARQLQGAAAKPGPFKRLTGVEPLDRMVLVDQAPIGRTPRSNAATYTGLFDEVRKIFAGTKLARQRGYSGGRFSFNVKGGRCEACQGQGQKKIEMKFLSDLSIECPTCRGQRFTRETLRILYKEKSIAEVLAMAVDEALPFFENFSGITRMLTALANVGLGYLPLGQPATTLSGGEAQRIQLATELGRPTNGHTLYILDEPTTGLHPHNIQQLLGVLHQLVDAGNSVLVIEHQTAVMQSADWLIDMGPEGGTGGGQIVVAGTPEQVAACPTSPTGRWLREQGGCPPSG